MTFDWFPIFNLTEWEATGLSSRVLTLNLEGRGVTEIPIVRGARTNVSLDGVLLPVGGVEGESALYVGLGGLYAVYLDEDSQDVYLGFVVEEEEEP